jgi:hypothetical protein
MVRKIGCRKCVKSDVTLTDTLYGTFFMFLEIGGKTWYFEK